MNEGFYTKDELKESERFKGREDALEALLKKDVYYAVEEAEEIIEEFMKGRI